MTLSDRASLEELAGLIAQRNQVDAKIAGIIGRPAVSGHIGEYVASHVFDVALESSATNAGFDGRFRSGPYAGKSVNIKKHGKRGGWFDITPSHVPDHFLVLAGPKAAAASSRGTHRPWVITEAFLFDAPALVAKLKTHGIKLGVGTSVTAGEWENARVYPLSNRVPMTLSGEAVRLLSLFRGELASHA